MAVDLSKILVVGVSSRALFDLEEENKIFAEKGITEYRQFQLDNETKPLNKGAAFYLVESLLRLNSEADDRIVEIVVMSKNSPETGVRMLNSIAEYGLDITRIALSGGEPLSPYIDAYDIDLFLSKDEKDVQAVIDANNCAAAIVYPPPQDYKATDSRVKIAFDADAVIFSENSEIRYKTQGMAAFHKYEEEHTDDPLEEGPFATLLKKLSSIQSHFSSIEYSPLRIAIVTARNAPSHMRVIKTLRDWNVYVDEMYFLGGLSKDKVLKAFGAQIFFDDQATHLDSTSQYVTAARVPYRSDSPLANPGQLEQLKLDLEQVEK